MDPWVTGYWSVLRDEHYHEALSKRMLKLLSEVEAREATRGLEA